MVEWYYTRAGNFNFDAEGNLVNPANGMKVIGWVGDVDRIAENLSSMSIIRSTYGCKVYPDNL